MLSLMMDYNVRIIREVIMIEDDKCHVKTDRNFPIDKR